MDKLYYKLNLIQDSNIYFFLKKKIILTCSFNNNIFSINNKNFKIKSKKCYLTIWKNKKNFFVNINSKKIYNLYDYDNIKLEYNDNNKYHISINYPLSTQAFKKSHYENLNWLLNSFSKIDKNYQLNIQHIDPLVKTLKNIDRKIINNPHINYIYVEKPKKYTFNLGYTRNLYKYLSFSDKILFCDIDIPITNNIIDSIYKKIHIEKYDIVKPYNKLLYNTNEKQKKEWIKKNNYNLFDNFIKKNITSRTSIKLYSITGGITAFRKEILIQTGGFDEIDDFGFEDRIMDVHILNIPNIRIFKFNYKMFHLFHTRNYKGERKIKEKTLLYNKTYYNCFFNKNSTKDIHEYCNHKTQFLKKIEQINREQNGNLKLFKLNNNKYPTLKILNI